MVFIFFYWAPIVKNTCTIEQQSHNKIIQYSRTMSGLFSKNVSVWYKDGSRLDVGAGLGIWGPGFKLSVPLGKTPTIFRLKCLLCVCMSKSAFYEVCRRHRFI
ncbi:hypothetical protein NQ315_014981 [Exocentrus adspersus]|uniref:Uncharacterized protein n=1 Tax=Exocentrus adspersus TaxID=1586481 RepID=A0AAV8VWB1_9CUCU|nr:hypothetical protein NQ315_014981 [Exocentrus adspersus]